VILRIAFSILFFLLPLFVSARSETNRLLSELDGYIGRKSEYTDQKWERINTLLKQTNQAIRLNDYRELYDLYNRLSDEYKSFIYDSAFFYINKLNQVAPLLNDRDKYAHAKIKMGFTLLSSGLFKESLDSLLSIDLTGCKNDTKQEYYSLVARTYYDLADYDNDVHFASIYRRIGNRYLDSAIFLLHEDTPEYWAAIGLLEMKSNDLQGSADAFNFLISKYEISIHQYAIATSSVAYVYTLMDREYEAIDMLIKASIADIKSSTRETVALRNLAVLLMKRGDIDRAYRYIKIALEDATFYNARHRKIEVGAVLPIIEGERLRIVESQKKKLTQYSLVVTLLSIVVLAFSIIIFMQLRRLIRVRRMLQEYNSSLQEMNHKLEEANIIKEEYIGHFFTMNSEFIEKLESYRKNIQRKIATRQIDDLANIISNTDLKKERESLFLNFDKIFIKLFPRFVDEFNSFFKEEDRVVLKHDELLNSDLRIFALMRLGITDSEKIAKFLDFSVNTIYTYRTKIKHKAVIGREDFDERIMQIKAL
jgi:tetratricopeptide (TPR) repeat protein